MRILVVYQLRSKTDRNTIYEHLYSFRKFAPEHKFHYINVIDRIPFYITKTSYDAVIFHYTFLGGNRFLPDEKPWEKITANAYKLSGYKIAIPQDEYDHTDKLNSFFLKAKIKAVYTCFTNDEDIRKAYPFEKSGVRSFFNVFTGYVDESKINDLARVAVPFSQRPIDIGYRARMLPAYFGRHGQLKYELVGVFNQALNNWNYIADIKNTNETIQTEDVKAVKMGSSWYDFLLSCKAFVGCEGGSSLLDADGSIKEKVVQYTAVHPNASFDEIEANCFPGQDYNISCFALSPRHFEAALCKTLQILVEGTYGGIFTPWEHYIPLKRDFSNIDEVLGLLNDPVSCQRIIDNAYRDVVLSGKASYGKFVSDIIAQLERNITPKKRMSDGLFVLAGKLLDLRNENYWKLLYYKWW